MDNDDSSSGDSIEKISVVGTKSLKNVVCQHLVVSGALSVDEHISVRRIDISGTAVVDGSVQATDIDISGKLRVHGDLETENATVSGRLEVEGRSKIQDFVLSGSSTFNALKSSTIVGNGDLESREIDANHIDQEITVIER